MNLIEAINELEKVQNIYIIAKDSNRVFVYKERGVENLNKHRLKKQRVYNIKRTGNDEALIEVYEWEGII